MNSQLSVVIPSYNEEENLTAIFQEVQLELEKLAIDYEIIIVDDGSRDSTLTIARSLYKEYPSQVVVVKHGTNKGSGAAIFTGIVNASYEKVIYIPADGQFAIDEIGKYLAASQQADIVIGARMARSDYSWFRLLSSKTFIFLANALFRQGFKDVNWVHLWKREIFNSISPKSTGVFFLEEVLVRASHHNYTIIEIDSQYKPRQGGKAKGSHPRVILKTIYEMMGLWLLLLGTGKRIKRS